MASVRTGRILNALAIALLLLLVALTVAFGPSGFKIAVGVFALVGGLGLFVGGLLSAAIEIRREKAAGRHVERPGWDSLRGYWRGFRSMYLDPQQYLPSRGRSLNSSPEDFPPEPPECEHGELAPEVVQDDLGPHRSGAWYCVDCLVIVSGPRAGRLVPYDGL